MSQPTTIHFHPAATLTLRAPRADVLRLATVAVHAATAVILGAAIVAAVDNADRRETGIPTRLAAPEVLVPMPTPSTSTDPAAYVAEPRPAPAPSKGR